MKFIAHRGASHDAPENTLKAVELAWEQNADAVEVDIHLSKDEEIIVMHDKNAKRTAGINLKIKDSYSNHIYNLDVGKWKHEKWKYEKIPKLEDIINTIPKGKELFIEIKSDRKIINRLFQILDSTPKKKQCVIISFNLKTLQKVKEKDSTIRTYWLQNIKKGFIKRWKPNINQLIKKAKSSNIDGLDLSACDMINNNFVSKIKENDLKLYIYTIDCPHLAQKMSITGIDGITTNKPLWLKNKLNF